jgi:hypothetical protein
LHIADWKSKLHLTEMKKMVQVLQLVVELVVELVEELEMLWVVL